MDDFFQDGPRLGNQFDADDLLRGYLDRHLPQEIAREITPDLQQFGQRVVGDLVPLVEAAYREEPRLVQYDPWGRRIDEIQVSDAWRQFDAISAQEGLVAIGYERQQGAWSRLYQFAKLYLFNPSSAVYTCPLAMTDGAARLWEVQGDERLKQRALQRLISRDPDQFWTSGQWMTEKTGGSDVGRTQTVARSEDGGYRLYGSKWFTSATTSQMTMTLARVEDSDHTTTSGSRGLSLFYLETHDDQGRLNQIEIHRLKDKLGTRSLPTAELTLGGTPAVLLGEPGRGVANIATLINITRVYNAVSAVASMRRGMALARDYARRREVFGRLLAEQPLHVETLADLEVELQGAFQLAFACVRLLGRDECGETDTNQRALLRILTPLAKLYTAKQCVAFMTELLESFGGAGYVEDTGLPRMLRDAQVLSIWEGTTNVLSLDALRAIDKDSAFEPLIEDARRRLADVRNSALTGEVAEVSAALDRLIEYLPRAAAEGVDLLQAGARGFAFSLARTYTATLLLEHAQWQTSNGDARGIAVVRRWLRRDLTPLKWADAQDRAEATALALGVELPLSKTELSPATSARASKEKSTDKKPAMERSPSGGEPTPQSSPVIQPSRVT